MDLKKLEDELQAIEDEILVEQLTLFDKWLAF